MVKKTSDNARLSDIFICGHPVRFEAEKID